MSKAASTPGTGRRYRRRSAPQEERRRPGRRRRGNIKTWKTKRGDVGFGVRFIDQDGVLRYERCGLASKGWSEERARAVLEHFLEQVRVGVYRPIKHHRPAVTDADPLFDDLAREFLAEHAAEVKATTSAFYDYIWRSHLSPAFGHLRLSEITYDVIRRYKLERLRLIDQIQHAEERGARLLGPDGRQLRLGPRTVNHAIGTLSLVLAHAVRRQSFSLGVNPAAYRDLRLKVPKTAVRDWLEADELMFLFELAGQVDGGIRQQTLRRAEQVRHLRGQGLTLKQVARELGISDGSVHWLSNRHARPAASGLRMALCLLGASGARNAEICRLRPVDLDFVHRKIRVGSAKTPRGVREIDMTPWLCNELEAYVLCLGEDYSPLKPLIPTRSGSSHNKDSLNRRIKNLSKEAAAMRLEHRLPPIPTRLTAHVFRRTYITLMLEAGAPPSYVQQQVGHEDAATTLNIYARVLHTRDRQSFGHAFDELMVGEIPPSPFVERGPDQATPRAA